MYVFTQLVAHLLQQYRVTLAGKLVSVHHDAGRLCDDTEPLLNPADLDDDGFSTCQGDCDDDVPSLTPEDADGDGVSLCEGDCDDTDSAIYLGAGEVPFNGSDDDCDPSTLDDDGDGAGWPASTSWEPTTGSSLKTLC